MSVKSTEGVDRPAVHRVSSFLPETLGPPNPQYDNFSDLFDVVQESDLVNQIAACVDDFVVDGEFDEERYLQAMLERFGDNLDELCDIMEREVPPVVVNPEPAPSPSALYSRVSGVEKVLDIGSGNCKKVSRCKAKVVATDIQPVENPFMTVKQLDANKDLLDMVENEGVDVVTSFNALTQLEDLTQVLAVDGLHIYPDTNYYQDSGAPLLDGAVKVGKHVDRIHPVLERGQPICDGYKVLTTFSAEKLSYEPESYTQFKIGFTPIVQDLDYRPLGESTPKYDGVNMMLVDQKGSSPILKTRVGRATVLTSKRRVSLALHLEKLPKHGRPQAFVLLRVLNYKGFVPFHGLETLRQFCAKVKLKIFGIRVVAPADGSLSSYTADGLIYRFGQMDYRYKFRYTIDTLSISSLVDRLANEYGIDSEYDEQVDSLGEYIIARRGEKVVFTLKGLRADKSEQTTIKTVVQYIHQTQCSV